MKRFVIAYAVVVEADTVSEVDDAKIGASLIDHPNVVEVVCTGPIQVDASDEDRTVWADVVDWVHP